MQFNQAHIAATMAHTSPLTLTIPDRGLDGKPVVVDGKLQRRAVTQADVDLWRDRMPAELVDAALGLTVTGTGKKATETATPSGAGLRQWFAGLDAETAKGVRGMVTDCIAAGVSRVTATVGALRGELASNAVLARATANGRNLSAPQVQRWAEQCAARGLSVTEAGRATVTAMAGKLDAEAAATAAAAESLRGL